MRKIAALVVALCLFGPVAGVSVAQQDELTRVRRQVQELEQRLRDIASQQNRKGREKQEVEAELSLATLRVREAEEELLSVQSQAAETAQEATDAKEKLAVAVEALRVQLALLSMVGRAGMAPLVFRALTTREDMARRVTVSLAVAEEQKRRRDEIVHLAEVRSAAVAELSRRQEEVAVAASRLVGRKEELEETRRRVQIELARLENERRSGAVALAEALESQERLERLWGRVTESARPGPSDVRLLRGGLPWPATNATVARRFGRHRDPVYGTTTVCHGIFLAVPVGGAVRAVAAGEVEYAQFFKGYGNVVIVKHGNEVYSLYAQLATMFPRVGQRVAIGDILGLVGEVGEGAGNFYLEIRVGQRPEDPLRWLKPVGR